MHVKIALKWVYFLYDNENHHFEVVFLKLLQSTTLKGGDAVNAL